MARCVVCKLLRIFHVRSCLNAHAEGVTYTQNITAKGLFGPLAFEPAAFAAAVTFSNRIKSVCNSV